MGMAREEPLSILDILEDVVTEKSKAGVLSKQPFTPKLCDSVSDI